MKGELLENKLICTLNIETEALMRHDMRNPNVFGNTFRQGPLEIVMRHPDERIYGRPLWNYSQGIEF